MSKIIMQLRSLYTVCVPNLHPSPPPRNVGNELVHGSNDPKQYQFDVHILRAFTGDTLRFLGRAVESPATLCKQIG
jgi:hypothetical protein